MKGNEEFSTKKVLSEPNVKVVFHQTAFLVTLLSTWIIYPKRSALGHSTRCLAETWLSEVDSLFCSRCQTCCAPLTKKGADTAATWTPSFQLLPALSRAEPEFLIRKGRQILKAAIPIGRAEQGEELKATVRRRARQSYQGGQKSVFPSDKTHLRPSSAFFVFDEKKSRSPKAFSFPRRTSLPSSSLYFNGWGKHSLI
ncbi:hypothetical protein FXO38_36475 [Capsicum annuum]|nr:hypothetical protein FXO38_36475 [Capsicum annuum]KAF3613058.1 hypothetical protein FXO37_36541 [Capsicum annuum]